MSFKENSKTLTDLTLQFQCEELRKQLEKFDEYGNISSEAFLNESTARKQAESELEKVCIQIPESDELEMTCFSKTSNFLNQAKEKLKENEKEFINLNKNWQCAEKQYMAEIEAKERKV